MKEEDQKSFTMRRSGWSSFSIIGYVIFGLLLPALLLTHVFYDYATYIGGYATYAETTIEQSIDANESEIAELETKISSANQSITTNKAAINELNAQIAVLESEIEAKKAAITASSAIIEENEATLAQLNGEISTLETEKAVLETTKQTLQADLERLNGELDLENLALQSAQNNVKNAEITLLQARKAVLEQTLNGLDKYEVDAADTLHTKIATLNEEIDLLRNEIATAYQTHESNSAQSKALEEEMKPNQTAIKDVQIELDKVNVTIGKHQATADACDEKIATTQQAIEDIKTQITETKPSIGDLAILLTDTEKQITALETEKAQLDPVTDANEIAEIEAQLNDLTDSLAQLQTQYETAYQTRKAQESQISEHEKTIETETAKKNEALAIIQKLTDENVTPLTEQKTQLEEVVNGYQQQIGDLADANTALLEEIDANTNTIEEKQAEILSCNKIINGLDTIDDASQIAALQEEITTIEGQIQKWETNELHPNANPIDTYTGGLLTLREQTHKQAVDSLNTAKSALSEEASKKTTLEEEITILNNALADNAEALQEKQAAISEKTSNKTETETAIETEQNNILTYEQAIEDMAQNKTTKENSATEFTLENTTAEANITAWNSEKGNLNNRVASLKKLLNAEGTALLHPEEIAIISAFEADSIASENPYQAPADATGLLTTTKILFETLQLSIHEVETLTYAFAILGVIFFLGALIVVCNKLRKAHRTQYVIAENMIYYPPDSVPAMRFILEQGATVQIKQSLKGFFFGYGTLIVSQSAGYAGECKISKIKSVRKVKRLLQEQIKCYGKPVKV